jgi:hypothetical protein
MDSARVTRGLALSLSGLVLCGALRAADPQFAVAPSSLSFGDVQLGEVKTLRFVVRNLLTTPLVVNITQPPNFFSASPAGQITLNPREMRAVDVAYPRPPQQFCDASPGSLTVTAGSERAAVSLSGRLICPELSVVGVGPVLSLQGDRILAKFSVINTGTVPSNPCTGQVLLDGAVVQNFAIPALTTLASGSGAQKNFEFLLPATRRGAHTVEVRVDTDNQNKEGREGDHNRKSNTITVP